MNHENKYSIVLLDEDNYEISAYHANSLKDAKKIMEYMLSEKYAKSAETNHKAMGTHKAEVRNVNNECILDKFM